MLFEDIGLKVPEILLPKQGIDMTKWTVVACDQYTSEPEYWQKVKEYIGDSPSTLNIIYPEVYLEESEHEAQQRIENINSIMEDYLNNDVFQNVKGFILVDRKTSQVESRKGLIVALDLEKYDYSKGSQTLIRATEKTIVERLPPRIKIRENAPIESPHIMVLIDDPEKTVLEPLFEKNLEKAYDFELMMDSGHIKGYKIEDENTLKEVAEKLSKIADLENFNNKYQVSDKGVLLFAMGDGNHSLATAKAIWEEKKKQGASMKDPARFALVELVNVHDSGLEFEPIHRVVFNVDYNNMLENMKKYYEEQGCEFSYDLYEEKQEIKPEENTHMIHFVAGDKLGKIKIKNPIFNLEVGTLQAFLDHYLKRKESNIDYIHGEDVVKDLGKKQDNMGFFLPPMSKHELFKTVIVDGALPRKTFSMGEADEKRFYLECRKIK